MTVNQWEARYGARRRAIDKKLLAEVERQIAEEERANPTPPVDRNDERQRIALAFGRPLR
jgi:hypothetical protein